MTLAASDMRQQHEAVRILRAEAAGGLVFTCDHASAHIPPRYAGLGLPPAELRRHIAWDIGALDVSERLSELLDAPLLHPTASRLLLDVNRLPGAHDAIPERSEDTAIPGNAGLSEQERRRRHDDFYAPYHDAIEALVRARIAARRPTAVVALHSFTPVFRGHARPWQLGVLSHHDRRMADALLRALRADAALQVGDNEPYAPRDGVYHTLDRHAEAHGLPCVMIEIRNDLISTPAGQQEWAQRLAPLLLAAFEAATAREPTRSTH